MIAFKTQRRANNSISNMKPRKANAPHSLRYVGFTLIELLISITLIAILVVILFMAAPGVRENLQATKCISNLRGLGASMIAYSCDFNGMLPPRNLGLYRDTEPKEPVGLKTWPSRLITLGYAQNPDVFYCPSFFPRNGKEAKNAIVGDAGAQTYGMRTWVAPGQTAWTGNKQREEHKPIAAISQPSDFFLLVDTVWTDSKWQSQGYGITPELPKEQLVHLRHRGKANALFVDGHVEAKTGDYFEALGDADRQKVYNAGRVMKFGVVKDIEFK